MLLPNLQHRDLSPDPGTSVNKSGAQFQFQPHPPMKKHSIPSEPTAEHRGVKLFKVYQPGGSLIYWYNWKANQTEGNERFPEATFDIRALWPEAKTLGVTDLFFPKAMAATLSRFIDHCFATGTSPWAPFQTAQLR